MATGTIVPDKFIYATGTVSVPAGSSTSTVSKEIDLSAQVPSGCFLVGFQLGAYMLPYATTGSSNVTGTMITWVGGYDPNSRILTIINRGSAWTNYIYRALFYKAP